MSMEIHALTLGVWYTNPVQAGDRPALGLAAGTRGAVLIDGGNSPAHVAPLLAFARGRGLSLQAVCLTHWHWDHCFGAVSAALPVIACEQTAARLDWMRTLSWDDDALAARVAAGTEMDFCRENIQIEYPTQPRSIQVPTAARTFASEETIDLGGLTVRLMQVVSDHSPDCCVALLPEAGVAFLGDCLYLNMDHEPWHRTPARTRALMERLLALDAQWYVPAHHGLYTRAGFAQYAAQMTAAANAAEGAPDMQSAARRFKTQTGAEPNEDEQTLLAEFLAARAYE